MIYILLGLAGAVLFVWGIASLAVMHCNAGLVAQLICGAALMCFAVFHRRIESVVPRWAFTAVCVCALAAFGFMLGLYFYGQTATVEYDEQAVIVLGGGLRGGRPSLALAKRLNRAIEYHEKNPDALIIVSGGQSFDEPVPESSAMKDYLAERGIPENLIIEENKSTSTYENMVLSKTLLDGRFGDDYGLAVITTDFHMLRAVLHASTAGFTNIKRLASDLKWYLVPSTYIRECFAFVKYALFRK